MDARQRWTLILTSVACALAPSIGVLIAARAAQGIGTAMVLPQAPALLSAAFPPATRGKAMGLFAGITGLAILGGPVTGGVVVQGLAWQWIFWLNVPIGIALIPLVSRYIAEAHGPRTPFDAAGLALSGAGLLGLVWGLVRGNAAGWGSPQVYGPLAAGTALIVAFAAWERRRVPRCSPWIALGTGGSYPALIPGMVLAGVGVSAALPAAQNAAVSSVRREAIGTASGVYNAMRQVGGAFGIAIASAVFAAAGSFASPAAVSHGVRMALLVTAAISAAGALAGAGLRATRAAGLPAGAPRITTEAATVPADADSSAKR
jgi:Major Facilitator Superfamily